MAFKKSEEKIKKDTEEVINLTITRNHLFIEGECLRKESPLTYFCISCQKVITTTFGNYKRARMGCETCWKKSVSEKLKGRIYTPETIAKMTEANNKRPDRGGQPRDWRETNTYKNWRLKVYEQWGNKCAITGEPVTEKQTHVVHHLESASTNEELIYEPLNGIVLKKELHENFHKKYGYHNNTIQQFQQFIRSFITNMPISSQALPEGKEGSETKAYDPARIMKLHERLEVISSELKKLSNPD